VKENKMSKKTVLLCGVDGYIGNALCQRLLNEGYEVVGIDNFLRRFWIEHDMKSKSAIPILSMDEKIQRFKKMGDFHFYNIDISKDPSLGLEKIFKMHLPEIIVNLAHIPSGPYSQISREHANTTLKNNILGTNNMLWLVREIVPECHYITIGTTGEYDHYANIDIEEGYIKIKHKGRESVEMIYPRRPGSIYHSSKTASTYLIDFLTRTWMLKCTDVQQSIVFGSYTDDINKSKIYSRLDSDEAGGTVINRFIVQTLIGEPLTIYGEGKHQRGFLSLNDSIQALMIAVKNEPISGHVQVWNQLSEWHSMNEIAGMVVEVAENRGMNIDVRHIPSPRTEYTGNHYYKYSTAKLASLGYIPTRTIKQEVDYVFGLLSQSNEYFDLKDVVIPKIKWRK
jgi:UDP-sulfoquinovose synthase